MSLTNQKNPANNIFSGLLLQTTLDLKYLSRNRTQEHVFKVKKSTHNPLQGGEKQETWHKGEGQNLETPYEEPERWK